MSLRHFADDAVGSEQTEFSRYPGGGTPSFFGFRDGLGIEMRKEVAITKAANGKLSATDRLQQKLIFLRPGSQGTFSTVLPADRPAYWINHFQDRTIGVEESQAIQIALIGGL